VPEADTSRSPRALWLLLALAALTIALGASIPLAPVHVDQPVVTWPPAGQQVRSTALPLVPYRPLSLRADIDCATLRALDARPGTATALRTMPADADAADQGLRVSTDRGRVVVRSSATTVLVAPLPPGDCRYQVVSDAGAISVSRDGRVLTERGGVLAPQVSELATDADPARAGLTVTLRPDDRYASQPTALKTVLLLAHLLALAATLLLAVRCWRGRRPPDRPGLVVPRPSPADAVLVAVAAGWAVLGGVNWDDSWYLLMARNAGQAGYLGNYVYMFNAAENPFVASQYLMQAWGTLGEALGPGWSLLWMRVLPLAYGLATWVLLRVVMATALGRAGTLRRVPWLMLVAFLLWWLPYDMMLRPEPLIVLCTAGVLVLVELAARRRSLGVLVPAVAVAALALTVSPSGAVAFAPLLTALPWLVPLLREHRAATGRAAVVVAGLAAVAALTIVIPVAFGDASLGEVIDANLTHNWYYLSYSWYQEILHYNSLLLVGDTGVWGRRAPVVLTLAALVLVAIGSGRRQGAGDPLRRLLVSSAITMTVALALIALTPTKWVNHFGALSAIGAVVLTAALLRSAIPRPAGSVATGTAVLVIAAGAGLVFAGPNLWRPYSDWGQPFGDHREAGGTLYEIGMLAPHLGPVYLRNPLLWLAAGGLIAAGAAWWRRRGGRSELKVDRGLFVTACGVSVVLMLGVFVVAPLRHKGMTVAEANLRTLTGRPCGLGDAVQVLAPTGPQPSAAGAARATGDFVLTAGSPGPVQPPEPGAAMWHDAVPDQQRDLADERGTLSTPWYRLPADSPATHLTVPVAAGRSALTVTGTQAQAGSESTTGTDQDTTQQTAQQTADIPEDDQTRTERASQVRVQFGVRDGTALVASRTMTLDLDNVRSSPTTDSWRELAVPLTGIHADSVRVLVRDAGTGPDSWLAVAAPSLTSWQSVGVVTRGQPAFADQLAAALWPCVNQVTIRHGIAQAPAVRLLTNDGIPMTVLRNPLDPLWGGSFVQASQTATYVTMSSRIGPPDAPNTGWGEVQRVVYDHPVGLVDLRTEPGTEPGWRLGPRLDDVDYVGRRYQG
jgi:arabinosyltransferase B/arabinosyltransferase C